MTNLDEIKAGKYEIVALYWDETLSEPGKPHVWKRHRKGAIVELDEETARRLVSAGAAAVPGERERRAVEAARMQYEQALAALKAVTPDEVLAEDEPDGSTPAPPKVPTIAEITKDVGDDPAKAQAALDAEQGRADGPRSTLVTHLKKVLAGSNGGD